MKKIALLLFVAANFCAAEDQPIPAPAATPVPAADAPAPPKKKEIHNFPKDALVLDLNGESTMPERRASPVLKDLADAQVNAGPIIFKRLDFNDFHDFEKSTHLRVESVDSK